MTKKVEKKIIPSLLPNPPPNENKCIKDALLQKAVGFQTSEIVEEYSCEDGVNLTLCKKKVSIKQYPPDLDAVQKLFELNSINNFDVKNMTDFELEEEKAKLLNLLKEKEGEQDENNS